MAEVPVMLSGVLYDHLSRTERPSTFIGKLSLSGLGVGGGPMPPQAPVDPDYGVPIEHPEHPIARPPGYPSHPIYYPGAKPEHPIVIPPPPDLTVPPPEGVKPPPEGGGWGYSPDYGWGYFPMGQAAGPK